MKIKPSKSVSRYRILIVVLILVLLIYALYILPVFHDIIRDKAISIESKLGFQSKISKVNYMKTVNSKDMVDDNAEVQEKSKLMTGNMKYEQMNDRTFLLNKKSIQENKIDDSSRIKKQNIRSDGKDGIDYNKKLVADQNVETKLTNTDSNEQDGYNKLTSIPDPSTVNSLEKSKQHEIISKSFPKPLMFQTNSDSKDRSVLVVGGTDGSGTRRVVQLLTLLGVTMVSEDPETYDIHADSVGGWPTVVSPVLKSSHGLNYDPDTLPNAIQYTTTLNLRKLISQAEIDSKKGTSHTLAVGGTLPKPAKIQAASISYGFKAPVSMTLVPWWTQLLTHFKFVHVLRDGRDIAFSLNQGPVEKFYADMYTDRDALMYSTEFKAIKLWSDWNSQIYFWAKNYAASEESNLRSSFGYYGIHTEDLVSESVPIRFAAIYHLAKFVGSSISDKEMCCLALQDSEFMGSHDRTQLKSKKSSVLVNTRYGKWKSRVQYNKGLNDALHRIGEEGLKVFGYEPFRNLADESMGTEENGFVCNMTDAECGFNTDKPLIENPYDISGSAGDYAIKDICTTIASVDYKGEDIRAISVDEEDKSMCCKECKSTPKCEYFTISPQSNMCYLKYGNTFPTPNSDLISGAIIS